MKWTIILLAITGALATAVPRATQPTVSITNGTVVGSTTNNVDSFLGIPFAQPPVGNLRLRPPQSYNSTFKAFQATSSPRACPQFSNDDSDFPENIITYLEDTVLYQEISNAGEDCLTITVQRPAGVTNSTKLPVLFWIYGGGYSAGATNSYDGTQIVLESVALSQPIMFVEANYRVGPLGFLGGKEVKNAGVANLGYLDQRLAMKWVAENIGAFGGDPDKVTIWGESAGSASVFDQLTMYGGDNTYKGKALFRAAIMDSGNLNVASPVDSAKPQELYNAVVSAAGCSSSADTLSCLRQLDYSSFLNAGQVVPSTASYQGSVALTWRPRPDGIILPDAADVLLKAGRYARVPIIVGDQSADGTLGSLFLSNITTTETLVEFLSTVVYPTSSSEGLLTLVNTYSTNPADGVPENTGAGDQLYTQYKRNAALLTDVSFRLVRRKSLEIIGSAVPTWSYVSTYLDWVPYLGTFHTTDLTYAFNNDGFVSKSIQGYYISFITNLNPNTKNGGLTQWPQWIQNRQLLNFGASVNSLTADDFRNASYAVISANTSLLTQ